MNDMSVLPFRFLGEKGRWLTRLYIIRYENKPRIVGSYHSFGRWQSYKLITKNKIIMNLINNASQMTMILIFIALQTIKVFGQAPPSGKYDTTNYPEDRKFINSISNIFDPSLSLNDNSISIGADGSIAYGLEEELKKFERNGMTFKSVVSVPGTELVRIFNGHTAIKTKIADVVFSTPDGDLHFKVIRAETYIKDNGKWYYVLGQGTNFMTQEEFDEYKKAHTTKN